MINKKGKKIKNPQNQVDIFPHANWQSIFMAKSGGFSSKRIAGFIGFFVCIGLLISAFITGKEVPAFGDMVIVTSASLLGIDAFRGIFSRQTNV